MPRDGSAMTYETIEIAIAQTKDFRSLEDKVGAIIFLATGGFSDGG